MEKKVYSVDGKELRTIALDDTVFGLPVNEDVIYYAINKCSEYNFCDINNDDVTDLSDFTLLASKLLDKDNFSKIKDIVLAVTEDGVIDCNDITLLNEIMVNYNIISE